MPTFYLVYYALVPFDGFAAKVTVKSPVSTFSIGVLFNVTVTVIVLVPPGAIFTSPAGFSDATETVKYSAALPVKEETFIESFGITADKSVLSFFTV